MMHISLTNRKSVQYFNENATRDECQFDESIMKVLSWRSGMYCNAAISEVEHYELKRGILTRDHERKNGTDDRRRGGDLRPVRVAALYAASRRS